MRRCGTRPRRQRRSSRTLSPSMPTGKPTNADFPSAASTPPVSIMTPEPVAAHRAAPAGIAAGAQRAVGVAVTASAAHAAASPRRRAAKKQAAAPKHACGASIRRAGPADARSRRAGAGSVERLMLSKPSSMIPDNGVVRSGKTGFHFSDHALTSLHATSSHQACRRLRVGQGTQGLGRRAHADREEKGPAARIIFTSPG